MYNIMGHFLLWTIFFN